MKDLPSAFPSHRHKGATPMSQHGWIIDPSQDDHDLADFLCGPSANGSWACLDSQLRNCTWDPVLSKNPAISAECGIAGCYACLHKTLIPLAPADVLTGLVMFACGVLAGASGIGGGGLNVPLLMLFGGFLVEEAVPLSHLAVFGNAIAQNLVNVQCSHPHDPSRMLIDLDMPLLLLPASLGGNALGVLIGPSLPSSGVEILACLLLFFASAKTLRKASETYKKELAQRAVRAVEAQALAEGALGGGGAYDDGAGADGVYVATKPTMRAPLLDHEGTVASSSASLTNTHTSAYDPANPVRAATEVDETPALPAACASPSVSAVGSVGAGVGGVGGRSSKVLAKLLALILLWLCLVSAFVGSRLSRKPRAAEGSGNSGLDTTLWWDGGALGGASSGCSASRIAWLVAQQLVVLVAATAAALWLQREQRRRDWARTPLVPGDLRWSARNTTALPCAGAAIGLVAGLLGLGGGELIAPLLLIVGMLPQVGAATSACMVLFTSSSDVAHYLSEGVLAPDLGYVLAAATLGFTSALCGRLLALRLVRVLSHPSLIAFTLGGLLLGACGLLLAQVAEQAPDFSVAPIQCK